MAPVGPRIRTHWPHCPIRPPPGPWVRATPTSTRAPRPASHPHTRTLASATAAAVLGVSRVKVRTCWAPSSPLSPPPGSALCACPLRPVRSSLLCVEALGELLLEGVSGSGGWGEPCRLGCARVCVGGARVPGAAEVKGQEMAWGRTAERSRDTVETPAPAPAAWPGAAGGWLHRTVDPPWDVWRAEQEDRGVSLRRGLAGGVA